ncbi:hypothetical protein K443DRAFT_683132 [Laccaria amethystina LaAM-08-1]|uniref:Uncharacterized protein n=1 Tax=Laccaria amethystina LaAM-08-1 TaxID=1095629 RepID=A0A0C9X205_9AGAR|nr:hypothetical protein K443DRAFT_683132 [Laccaria amethystina LaAM-08-1]
MDHTPTISILVSSITIPLLDWLGTGTEYDVVYRWANNFPSLAGLARIRILHRGHVPQEKILLRPTSEVARLS